MRNLINIFYDVMYEIAKIWSKVDQFTIENFVRWMVNLQNKSFMKI